MGEAASRSTIAVLPKPGKLRASSTNSSNLSMSTSTSILSNLILCLRSLYLTVRAGINLPYGLQYAVRYQPAHLAAERGYLPHGAGAQKTVLRSRHDKNGLYIRGHRPVELRLLELGFEIRDGPQALDDRPRALLLREVHQQAFHHLHRNVFDPRGDLPY